MQDATELVKLEQEVGALELSVATKKERIAILKKRIETAIEEGEFPSSSHVSGAAVFIKRQMWAGPLNGDHAALTKVLHKLDLDRLGPKTVHSGTLSSYVREYLDPDETLPLDERLLSPNPAPIPRELFDALNITEKIDVAVTGAKAKGTP